MIIVVDLRSLAPGSYTSWNSASDFICSSSYFENLISDFEREMQAIHDAFLAPRLGVNEPAFPDAARARPNREEVIREPCQLVKQPLDPRMGASGAHLRPDRLNLKNAGKTPARASELEPAHRRVA